MYLHLLYIDPGTGSLAAQAVIAGIAAVIVFFRNSIKRIFSLGKKEERNNKTDA
jgi:hypothetical protein